MRKAGHGILDIIDSAGRADLNYEEARMDRYAQYYIEKNPQMAEFIKDPDSKSADEIKQLTKEYIKYLTGKDVEVVIIATGDGSGYIRGDQNGEDKKDVFLLDVTDLATGNISVADIYGHEPNHVDDHRRGRDAGDEVTSTAAGDRLSEILGENGKSSGFDLSEWLSNNENKQALIDGKNILDSEYEGYEMEGHPYKAPTNPNYYYNLLNAVMEEKKQFDDYFNPMSLIPEEKIFDDLYNGLVN